MNIRQFHMVVLNEDVPCEIDAVVNGYTYYWRSRGGRWKLFRHVVDSVDDKNLLDSGSVYMADMESQVELGMFFIVRYHVERKEG